MYINIGNNISGTRYDVAHVKWGGSWRMPTEKEIRELVDNCFWKWTTYNGVAGQLVTGPNGNSIFLPATGVWDETLLDMVGEVAYYLTSAYTPAWGGGGLGFYFDDEDYDFLPEVVSPKYGGFSVRAVM